jgi:ubiquinone/menaquinone biosynthesis C-methylase UbiE
VDHRHHVALLRPAVTDAGGTWADVGSGTGAFTLALADLLGPSGHMVSIDRDASALETQARAFAARFPAVTVRYVVADFTGPLDLPPLDGLVMANSLHFVKRDTQVEVIRRLAAALGPGGRFVVVEYDTDRGNQWVPHPFRSIQWLDIARAAGLANAREIGRVPSGWLGSIYSAVAEVPLTG